jgi:hypothetical protein
LVGDPRQRIVAIIRVIGVDPVLAFGAVAAPAILIDGDIAMLNDRLPAAQDRAAHRLGRIGQPSARVIEFMQRTGGGNAVRRAVEDHRPAGSPFIRQKNECIEADAIAHRHHCLK